MNGTGRIEKSLLNVFTGLFGQLFSFVLSFCIQTVFIKVLGEVYLGLNGLYTNILSVLNLTELGLGTAIVLELYRTLQNNNREKTKQYLNLYRKAYLVIGLIILFFGLLLIPFLQYFVNDTASLALINYKLIFVLYLFNTIFSYFFFAYRESILSADQKEYKARVITYFFKFIEMILQIVSLLMFRNIYIYLIIPIIIRCISTIYIGIKVGQWYPFIKEKPEGKLSKEELMTTSRNIGSVAIYKVSGVVINSTDNILLSSFVSIIITGLYSNYLVITSAVSTILSKVFSAFTASLGNLNVAAGDDYEKKYEIFNVLSFLNFWGYGFCSVCLYVLFSPFISVWIGESFIMNKFTEFMIVVNFLIIGLQETVGTHRAAYGLFYKARFRPIFSILINLISSLIFVNVFPKEYGVVAVLLGTIISNVFVSWWYDGYLVCKYAFNRSPITYYVNFWKRLIFVLIVCLFIKNVCSCIHVDGWCAIILYLLICVVGFHSIFILCFIKSKEFLYVKDIFFRLLKKYILKR